MEILGIDIGGTGIKGAPVDINTGKMLADRYRIETPRPATPKKIAAVVKKICEHFSWQGYIGCGFPGVVRQGVVITAINIHPAWENTDAIALFAEKLGLPVCILNDADAAGLAEIRFGAGAGVIGSALMITLGTGVGTALFVNGSLVPNLELGHLEMDGASAETQVADAIRRSENLSWKQWGKRLDRYLETVERLVWPDLIILGGGVSKNHKKFFKYLKISTPIVPAKLKNEAGIVGAAIGAAIYCNIPGKS